ncbi:MAG: hypothetical protein HAW66_08045 [Shewanella sp.]|nr:hypothetical protein [Shewanella sp.]
MAFSIFGSARGSYSPEHAPLIEPESKNPTFIATKSELAKWLVSQLFPNENATLNDSPAFNLQSSLIARFNAQDEPSVNTTLAQCSERQQDNPNFEFKSCKSNDPKVDCYKVFFLPTKSLVDNIFLGKISTSLQ